MTDYPLFAPKPEHASAHDWPELEQPPPGRPDTAAAVPDGPRERTDDGNALRLVDRFRDQVRYVPERGTWLTWTGSRWATDPPTGGIITEHARRVARELPRTSDPDRTWRKKSLSADRLRAMVNLARSDRRVVAHVHELDARPYELNTPAGVVDLRTGALRAPDPDALHTRTTTIGPDLDPDARPVAWERFLADTFAGDPDLTRYVQRLLGVSILGIVLEQILPFAHGAGANGKSTMAGVVQRILGLGEDGYTISAPAELLTVSKGEHPTEIARLSGARLVITAELDEGQRFAEAKVKSLTGRDVLSGRFMRQDFFSFRPTHTLWLLANHQPHVRTGGDAFWRRIKLVPFLHTVPAERRDPTLEDRLVETEGPAILAWLIRGAVDYLTHGLAEPAEVVAATAAYQRDQDTVARFVEEQCSTGEPHLQHLAIRSSELYDAYTKWCAQEGETHVSQKAMVTALKAKHGVVGEHARLGNVLRGIRLNDVDGDPGPPEPGTDPWAEQDQQGRLDRYGDRDDGWPGAAP